MKPVRYSYGITAALLAGGATISLITGQAAGAQVAQNDRVQLERVMPDGQAPSSFADLAEVLQPAVVNISTRQRITIEQQNPFEGTPFADMFGNRGQGGPITREGQSLGSGFIVTADGYVVTNNHVVSPDARAQLQEVTVTLPSGEEYQAELVGTDPQSDLAVLKISRPEPFPFVRFGESASARVGDWVIAIGNPFGLGGTVTSGIISSVLRTAGGGAYDRYLQTDASINRGNSGGPLFDMGGNVIGVNNAIISPTGGSVGIGFAIPADVAQPIIESLINGEEILRGYLGVQISPVSEDMAEALGIERNRGEIIQGVQDGEPAATAGLEAGDVVLAVNGEEITPDTTLSFVVANISPGTTVPVRFLRNGDERTLNVTVGRRPSEEELREQQMFNGDDEDAMPEPSNGDGMVESVLGVQVVPMTPRIASQLGVPASTQGLAITAIDPNSDAARKGLQRGAIILQAQGNPVATVADLEAVLSAARADGRAAVLLRVRPRGAGRAASVAVRLNTED